MKRIRSSASFLTVGSRGDHRIPRQSPTHAQIFTVNTMYSRSKSTRPKMDNPGFVGISKKNDLSKCAGAKGDMHIHKVISLAYQKLCGTVEFV